MKNNIYTCIEIGSYEIKILVCNLREERLFVLTQKCIESMGVERGQVTNFDKLVGQIKKIKELAELDLRQPLKSLILTMSPVDAVIEPVLCKINLDVKQPINSNDVRKLFRQAMSQPYDETYLPVSLVPRLFKIYENHVVQNPRGLSGLSLGVEAGRVLMPATTVSNLVHAIEASGFKVSDIVVGSISETLLALTTPEMYARTCHINVGHSMTTLTVVNDGKIAHARSLSIGGRDITRQIAEKFNIPETIADQLKVDYGRVIPHAEAMPDNQVIYVDDSNEGMKFITRGMLNEVITDRSDKLFKIIKIHIVDEMKLREQEYHYSLAGGAAELPNILYSLQSQLPMVATIHRPTMLGVRNSKFSGLVGSAIFTHELTLLLGSNSNTQSLEFNVEAEKAPAVDTTSKVRVKTKKDIIPQIDKEKVLSPLALEKEEDTQSLKDAIAAISTQDSEEVDASDKEKTDASKVAIYDDFDNTEPLDDEETELADDYIDQKLENSGVLVRFFDRIFNENDEVT